jgi:hypothetical protein
MRTLDLTPGKILNRNQMFEGFEERNKYKVENKKVKRKDSTLG